MRAVSFCNNGGVTTVVELKAKCEKLRWLMSDIPPAVLDFVEPALGRHIRSDFDAVSAGPLARRANYNGETVAVSAVIDWVEGFIRDVDAQTVQTHKLAGNCAPVVPPPTNVAGSSEHIKLCGAVDVHLDRIEELLERKKVFLHTVWGQVTEGRRAFAPTGREDLSRLRRYLSASAALRFFRGDGLWLPTVEVLRRHNNSGVGCTDWRECAFLEGDAAKTHLISSWCSDVTQESSSLWSIYGESGRGVCVTVDPTLLVSGLVDPWYCGYWTSLPTLLSLGWHKVSYMDSPQGMNQKPKAWESENEYRLVGTMNRPIASTGILWRAPILSAVVEVVVGRNAEASLENSIRAAGFSVTRSTV